MIEQDERSKVLEKRVFNFLKDNTTLCGRHFSNVEICDRLNIMLPEWEKVQGLLDKFVNRKNKNKPGIFSVRELGDFSMKKVYYYHDPAWLEKTLEHAKRDVESMPAWMRALRIDEKGKSSKQEQDHYVLLYESLRDNGAYHIKSSSYPKAYEKATIFMRSQEAKKRRVLKALGIVRILECYDNTLAEVLQSLGASR